MKHTLAILLLLISTYTLHAQNSYPTPKDTFMKLDGGGITIISPDKTGGWARGFRYYLFNQLSNLEAGMGLYGKADTIYRLYIAHGSAPHNSRKGIYVLPNGNTGIGTLDPVERLSVNGRIRAKEVKVETANWPDYVFKPGYVLMPLSELEQHIRESGHLPGIPNAAEVSENGVELGEMNRKLLEKIEELTLHMIEREQAEKRILAELAKLKAAIHID